MMNKLSFWLAIIACISFGLGTLPTIHGLMTWFVGVICVIGLRYLSKRNL